MSLAGKRSTQGDEYQLCIALHWLIKLIEYNSIEGIQIDSVGLPGQDGSVSVDDIVILYKNGHACFIQAKKNQKEHKNWSLSDSVLKEELGKAREQLESKEDSEVKFYSRSPFGELKALIEECKHCPDYLAFQREAPEKKSKTLKTLSKIFDRSEEEAYKLVLRISFGPPFEFEDWDGQNDADLDRLLPRADLAKPILERYLVSHEANLRDSKHTIAREDVLSELAKHGLSPTPKRSEAEILDAFKVASGIGRNWLRTIDGKPIHRAELSQLIELIKQDTQTILLTDSPGSGKTCLLLDLADEIERSFHRGLLFVKGDQFTNVNTERDLIDRGLPEDIVGQCARLTRFRRVVVIIDSLDVLSLSRQHDALKVFLGLIDRLEKIEGVTVITACRSFDLEYDPLLRGRSWQNKVNLQPLDFENFVKPFLRDWGIHPSSISAELQKLLQIPQNLRIYEKLAKRGTEFQPASVYQLYDSFLEEVVVKNPRLGDEALRALQTMAESLMQRRVPSCHKVSFEANENVVRELISQEVLWESTPSMLAFSHQTLADCLTVRANLANGITLEQFILDRPQFPFIRPAVRAFFFFLRVHQPIQFRRQVWQVLSHDDIAYHVKRLICESFGEIEPVEEDWRLLRRIFQQDPDLFRRLLSRITGKAWFDILRWRWLAEVEISPRREDWLPIFCRELSTWANQHPADVIALWREAIASEWADRHQLIGAINAGLDKFEAWNTEGVRELLETLINLENIEQHFLGKSIRCWVQATNSGDDLLWQYITKNVTSNDLRRYDLNQKLRCTSDEFHRDKFITERLSKSDEFLNLVLSELECWSTRDDAPDTVTRLRNQFLYYTSWKSTHNQHETYCIDRIDSLAVLLNGLENAFKARSRQNDAWWQANEPHLRNTKEVAIRYITIQAYKENIQANIPGIEAQLLDEELFRFNYLYDRLSYELGELMGIASPYISESVRVANQEMILSLYADRPSNVDEPSLQAGFDRTNRKVFNLTAWIPSIFRIPKVQSLISDRHDRFGHSHPSPEIYSRSGTVKPPLSSENFLSLSDDTLLRLLHYYEKYPNLEDFNSDWIGGCDSVILILHESCSLHPARFLDLFPRFIEENFHARYLCAVVEGIATHLRYRFGNLSSQDTWKPVEPLPEGNILASDLLNLLERYPSLWENGYTVSQAIESCGDVLDDPESADRLTLLLFWLHGKNLNSEQLFVSNSDRELYSRALNSTDGVAAMSAMRLCNRLLEKDCSLPELLPDLLHHFARSPQIDVRVPILEQLPFLIYKQPDLGWKLLDDVFQEPQPRLWKYAEKCLYYQYRNNFDRVRPYLNRMFSEGMAEAGDTWGRISTLASLAGYISKEKLFATLNIANDEAWRGATQVFAANLKEKEHKDICSTGLITILRTGNLSNRLFEEIDLFFRESSNWAFIQHEFVLAFLDSISRSNERYSFWHFYGWICHQVNCNLLLGMETLELVLKSLEQENDRSDFAFGNTEPLIAALNEILREADERDDSDLIHRAIELQDCFLRLNVYGIEKFLANAARS